MSNSSESRDTAKKINALENIITKDIVACDAKWTLFVAAAQSYRYNSMLKPFPPQYLNGEQCNIDQLLRVISQTPPLQVLLRKIVYNIDELSTSVVDLLHWVLLEHQSPALKAVEREDFDTILEKVPYKQKCPRPTHIFELVHTRTSSAEKNFEEHASGNNTNFAFHGSKLDSFHSILTHGLNQHMCKENVLFGEGIYLSSELSVTLNFSPFAGAWSGSRIGSVLSCVALCEYVEHPTHAKFHVHTNKKSKVPEKYVVITNNDIVRTRYLLVFGNEAVMHPPSFTSTAMHWIIQHKFTLGISCYLMVLASISLSNSRSFFYFKRIVEKKISGLLESVSKSF